MPRHKVKVRIYSVSKNTKNVQLFQKFYRVDAATLRSAILSKLAHSEWINLILLPIIKRFPAIT